MKFLTWVFKHDPVKLEARMRFSYLYNAGPSKTQYASSFTMLKQIYVWLAWVNQEIF